MVTCTVTFNRQDVTAGILGVFCNHVDTRARGAHLRDQPQASCREAIEDFCLEGVQRFCREFCVTQTLAVGRGVLEIIPKQFNSAPWPYTCDIDVQMAKGGHHRQTLTRARDGHIQSSPTGLRNERAETQRKISCTIFPYPMLTMIDLAEQRIGRSHPSCSEASRDYETDWLAYAQTHVRYAAQSER